MIQVFDLQNAPASLKFYGGHAGKKEGVIIDGENWIVKYPESTKGMPGKNLVSYTNSPISEFLGSHIYQLRGMDVHETLLGYRNGSIVVACKDFTKPDVELVEFYKLKNTVDDREPHYTSRPSDGTSLYLNDILRAIYTSPYLAQTPGVIERFWDMFVTDALIGNADRNSENWGLLRTPEGLRLAPVYDNGNCLFNKKRSSAAARELEQTDVFASSALGSIRTCYLKNDGHSLSPVKYIQSMENESCNAAVQRLVDSLDMTQVKALIDQMPEESFGAEVLSKRMGQFMVSTMSCRMNDLFLPVAKELQSKQLHQVPASFARAREGAAEANSNRERVQHNIVKDDQER